MPWPWFLPSMRSDLLARFSWYNFSRKRSNEKCCLVRELQFEIFTVESNALHTLACSREHAERMGNAWLVPDCLLFARQIIVSAGVGESSQKNATCSSSFADASSPLSAQPHFTRHDWYPYNVLWLKVAKSLLLWCGSQRDPSFCKCIKGTLTVVQKEFLLERWGRKGYRTQEMGYRIFEPWKRLCIPVLTHGS